MSYSQPQLTCLVRDLHPVERPDYKLRTTGPEAMSDQELLALVVGQDTALLRASKVLKSCDGKLPQKYDALRKTNGLPKKKATILAAAFELARRIEGRSDGRPILDSPLRIIEAVPDLVKHGKKEHLLAFYLNARSQLVHQETVSIGTLSASLVHPREVFSPAVVHSTAAVVVVHNHPSGDCSPSPDDRDTTRRLSRAGEILGIPLLDHLIVAGTSFFSMREHGLLGV